MRPEWSDEKMREYHARQLVQTYRSTTFFCDWLESLNYIHKSSKLAILDLCCGAGANLRYMSQRYPNCTFVGIDLNPQVVEDGNLYLKEHGIKNCHIEIGDIYNLSTDYNSVFDGVLSLQTLSWLNDFAFPVLAMAQLNPKWIAITSLFHDGLISYRIQVKEMSPELSQTRQQFYNIYSIPEIREFLLNKGYPLFQWIPFKIDIDLPKKSDDVMGTYTKKLLSGKRMQLSGALWMKWYFIVTSREE